jgi:hypothetical protein
MLDGEDLQRLLSMIPDVQPDQERFEFSPSMDLPLVGWDLAASVLWNIDSLLLFLSPLHRSNSLRLFFLSLFWLRPGLRLFRFVKRWKIYRESPTMERTGKLRSYYRLDAAPFSLVVSHFSPAGFDELQLDSRIRERSIRFLGLWSVLSRFWDEI